MNKDDLIKEQFKQALNSTIKAISGETYPLKDKKNLKEFNICLLYTSPSPRDLSTSRMPSSA